MDEYSWVHDASAVDFGELWLRRGPGRADEPLEVFAERPVAIDRIDDSAQPV